MKKDDLLEPVSLSSEQIIARVSFYYVIMITLLIFVQIVTGSNLYTLFGNEIFITNIIRGITGITGILLTLVFLNYDRKTISWLGFVWESNKTHKIIILSAIVGLSGVIGTYTIEIVSNIIIEEIGFLNIFEIIVTSTFTIVGIGIGEEIIYRGYIQKLLEQKYSFAIGAFVSSVLFGLHHFIIGVFVPDATLLYMLTWGITATIFGLSMSYVVKICNYNLIFAIGVHSIWDIFYFTLKIETYDYHQDIYLALIAIMAQLIGSLIIVVLTYYFYNKYFTNQQETLD